MFLWSEFDTHKRLIIDLFAVGQQRSRHLPSGTSLIDVDTWLDIIEDLSPNLLVIDKHTLPYVSNVSILTTSSCRWLPVRVPRPLNFAFCPVVCKASKQSHQALIWWTSTFQDDWKASSVITGAVYSDRGGVWKCLVQSRQPWGQCKSVNTLQATPSPWLSGLTTFILKQVTINDDMPMSPPSYITFLLRGPDP